MYKKNHIHFVGIGGIGMSGIAQILRQQGYHISGCDVDLEQQSILDLQRHHCIIYKGNDTPACHDPSIDILVYSSAIKAHNPEILSAQQRGIPTIPRALMLAELMRTKYSIAIAGAHGKTTTTSLISHILMEAQKDPTVIVGGHLKNIAANARLGKGEFLVAEADESDKSFLRLYPTLAIITNIDLEHLDIYRDLEDIKNTFKEFLSNIPFYGKAFVCWDDPHVRSLFPLTHIKAIKYGVHQDADVCAHNITLASDHSRFSVSFKGEILGNITFAMPGQHNIENALAAVALALDVEIPFATIAHALDTFKGIERRFSYKGTYKKVEIFDDYGHHPTEIHNTLLVARKRAHKKLIVAFQLQRYTRTYHLWKDFITILAQHPVDHLLITDIYSAGESPIAGITGKSFVESFKELYPQYPVNYVPFDDSFHAILTHLEPLLAPSDLLLLLGAGKMNKLVHQLSL
jgi:UDP-N-acetylmuramate--alanine ligase